MLGGSHRFFCVLVPSGPCQLDSSHRDRPPFALRQLTRRPVWQGLAEPGPSPHSCADRGGCVVSRLCGPRAASWRGVWPADSWLQLASNRDRAKIIGILTRPAILESLAYPSRSARIRTLSSGFGDRVLSQEHTPADPPVATSIFHSRVSGGNRTHRHDLHRVTCQTTTPQTPSSSPGWIRTSDLPHVTGMSCPLNDGTASTPTRTRTRNASFEARYDRPFHHRGVERKARESNPHLRGEPP